MTSDFNWRPPSFSLPSPLQVAHLPCGPSSCPCPGAPWEFSSKPPQEQKGLSVKLPFSCQSQPRSCFALVPPSWGRVSRVNLSLATCSCQWIESGKTEQDRKKTQQQEWKEVRDRHRPPESPTCCREGEQCAISEVWPPGGHKRFCSNKRMTLFQP